MILSPWSAACRITAAYVVGLGSSGSRDSDACRRCRTGSSCSPGRGPTRDRCRRRSRAPACANTSPSPVQSITTSARVANRPSLLSAITPRTEPVGHDRRDDPACASACARSDFAHDVVRDQLEHLGVERRRPVHGARAAPRYARASTRPAPDRSIPTVRGSGPGWRRARSGRPARRRRRRPRARRPSRSSGRSTTPGHPSTDPPRWL